MPDGYEPIPFDADEAVGIVTSRFARADAERWDQQLSPLTTRDEIRDCYRHHFIPAARAEAVDVPLWLTKRGALVTAVKD